MLCVWVEMEAIFMVATTHVNDVFLMGLKTRCDKFCEDLNQLVAIYNFGGGGGTKVADFVESRMQKH